MQRLRPLVLIATIGLLLWAGRHFEVTRYASLEGLRTVVDAWGPLGPLAFMGACVAGVFLHVPGIVYIAAGGVLFDGRQAFAYGWLASLIGTTATFLLVRYFARDYFQRSLTPRFERLRALDERLERNGFLTVLVLRLIFFLGPPLNWTLGATRVRLVSYVGGTALGVVPGIATTVFFADSIMQQEPGGGFFSGRRGLGLLLLATILVVGAVASRRFLDRTAPPS